MIDQVAAVHAKYGMKFFHMGADEAFQVSILFFSIYIYQVGYCNESVTKMNQLGSKERLMLWHMSRTAEYIKNKHKVKNYYIYLFDI